MSEIRVLDGTLRDGGCVNNFRFGLDSARQILGALEKTGVEAIELGYIENGGDLTGEYTKYANERVIPETLLLKKAKGISYFAMIDQGKYEIGDLEERAEQGIDGIRLAFHKETWRQAIEDGRRIREKGYLIGIQPMVTTRYSEDELLRLIEAAQEKIPKLSAFYLVDSFGQMDEEDVLRRFELYDRNVSEDIALGLHLHNNLQLAFANVIAVLKREMKHPVMIDSSILGMGKGAGNLNTELLLAYLNERHAKDYDLQPVRKIIDEILDPLQKTYAWGYAPEFALSAYAACSPSYAKFFHREKGRSLEEAERLLKQIPEEKKNSFDRGFAERLCGD